MTDSIEIRFFVRGLPAPGGSKRAIVSPAGKVNVIDDARHNKDWKSLVACRAAEVYQGAPLDGAALDVMMIFHMARPRNHYGTGRNAGRLKPAAPYYSRRKPDLLKLARSTEDACTGILWRDDSQTARLCLVKVYGSNPGVEIRVRRADGTF
jgi:crossover junction endodeoxyribonuclease RusA